MTDRPGSKQPPIPAWQTSTDATSESSPNTPTDAGGQSPAPDRVTILEQAKTFLEDVSVRNASPEKKLAFLEKKGLQGDEIQKLLDTASAEPTSAAGQDDGLKTVHDSSTSSSPSQPQPASQSNRDIPPIITYPEFLLRPAKPPPLITLERLTYSLYTLAGISALTYGASKHLIQPMLQSLTSSRHDLASTALHNLEKLNEKLQGNVSHIPAMSSSVLVKQRLPDTDNDNASDAETIDSDPTELFHRDIATQTSPTLFRSPSISSSSSSSTTSSPTHPKDTTTTQSTTLTTLSTTLSSLLTTESTTSTTQTNLLATITDCQSYLDKLQFSLNSHRDYHLLYGSATSKDDKSGKAGGGGGGGGGGDDEDEAMRFRQEIRAVKGALLSVRNFPVGSRPTAGVGVGVGVR